MSRISLGHYSVTLVLKSEGWLLRGVKLMIFLFSANSVGPKSRTVIFYPPARVSKACSEIGYGRQNKMQNPSGSKDFFNFQVSLIPQTKPQAKPQAKQT